MANDSTDRPSVDTDAAITCAIGCSERASTAAASESNHERSPAGTTTSTSAIFPSVTVPVLSSTIVSIRRVSSSTSPPLMITPSWAARPVPTMIPSGVARPSAHGQAMINTATAAVNASSTLPVIESQAMSVVIGDADRHRDEHGGDTVGEALHLGAAALGLVDQTHDLCERRVGADPGRLDHERTVLVDRRADHLAPRTDLDGNGLARHHRRIDRRVPVDDDAVRGHLLAGPDDETHPRHQILDRDLRAVDEAGTAHAEIGERPQRVPERRLARISSHLPIRISAMITAAVS